MTQLSMQQVANAALAALGGDREKAAVATAIAWAESGGQLDATNTNRNGSIDRGPWQINSVHGFDSRKLLTDLGYSASAMAKVSRNGTDWSPWVAYTNGAYRQHLAPARIAAAGGIRSVNPLDPRHFDDSVEAVVDAAGDVLDPLDAVAGFLGTLTSWETWRRILYVVAGTLAFGAGLIILGVDLTAAVPTPPNVKG